MSGEDCRAWRGELAGRALGRPDPDVDPGLDAHLDGCPDCRSDLEELRAAAAAAALADPEGLRVTASPPTLADRIVDRVAGEAASARRSQRERLLLGVAGAAAAVVVAVALVFGLTRHDGGETLRIELTGADRVEASAVLAARPWGTEVILEVSGLDEGEVYWLWLTDAGGERVAAGSLMGTGERSRVVLGSALPADEARRIWLTDEADEVVLDAEINPR